MNCFNHASSAAVGICKACQKGLCAECAVDVGMGLACKESCETHVTEFNEMNQRSLKIYGIGKYKSRLPSSGVMLWGALAVISWGVVGLGYYKSGSLNLNLAPPAVFFTIVAAFAFYSARRTGLNC